jgi:hypothetical protein
MIVPLGSIPGVDRIGQQAAQTRRSVPLNAHHKAAVQNSTKNIGCQFGPTGLLQ